MVLNVFIVWLNSYVDLVSYCKYSHVKILGEKLYT